ncbi:MAG: hypothetical protein A2Y25_01430 [Candidatus Melainabacteria bacterium GWF2_37_15]|nr:MAG: hypothetical protein A2Y25_01430 [Candidatus Melainabacteria bacterium GWF2_37_15]
MLIGTAFVLAVYFTVYSLSGMQAGIVDWLKSVIYDQQKDYSRLFFQMLSIGLLSTLTFLLYILFSSGLSAVLLARPDKFIRAIRWQLYKYFHSFLPFGIAYKATVLLLALSIIYFNVILSFSGINIGVVVFISTFIGLNILFLLIFGIFFGFWRLAKLSYGTEIAIIEPELANKEVKIKAKAASVDYLMVFLYLVFIVLFIVKLFRVDEISLIALLLLILPSYIGIKYLKTSAFVKSHV